MNTAEWILVAFLSVALLIFLILGIILLVKLIDLTKDAKKIISKGQDLADNANAVVNNVKTYTAVSGATGAVGSIYKAIQKVKQAKKGTKK